MFEAGKDVSTRAASGKVLNAIGPVMPELWGGSADLAESNNTTISNCYVHIRRLCCDVSELGLSSSPPAGRPVASISYWSTWIDRNGSSIGKFAWKT